MVAVSNRFGEMRVTMKTIHLMAVLCGLLLIVNATRPAYGQYDLSPDTTGVVDTTKSAPLDTTGVVEDTTQADTGNVLKSKLQDDNDIPAEDETPTAASAQKSSGIEATANEWLKRMLYRGELNATEIGAYAEYQLTAWDEKVGSYGPVEARLTVSYLGSSEWMGRDAEWLQAVFQTVDAEPTTVEYDLIVPSSSQIKHVDRALYRVNDGDLKELSFAAEPGQVDYDAADNPVEEGVEQIRLYTGTYDVEKFRGSGATAAKVLIYRSKDVPPLGIVRLGYGDEGLTLTDTGSDATPRLDVPPPPSVSSTGGDTQQH
jgi:hypothetical protein